MGPSTNKPPEDLKSPYTAFDYNKLQDETTVPAIKEIYKTLGYYRDLMSYDSKMTKDEIQNKQAEMAQKILEVLVQYNVPDRDMQLVIESFQAGIFQVFSIIARQKAELEKEFLARSIGARDPGTGKFSRDYTSLGDMFKALEAKRIEQDVDENQYFFVEKKEK